MKLVNYKRGYNERFDCSIHGTIYMTHSEWDKSFAYLKRYAKRMKDFNLTLYSHYLDLVKTDSQRQIQTVGGFIINIRVTATELLVERYNLTNYKRGNYQINVSNI